MQISLRATLLAGSALAPLLMTTGAHAACTVTSGGGTAMMPASGAVITCENTLETDPINAPGASSVSVLANGSSSGLSVTMAPGAITLGAGANIGIGRQGTVNTSGTGVYGINVTSDATITVNGTVASQGNGAPAIQTTERATVNVSGTVRTGGGMSNAIQVGADSTVNVRAGGLVTTGNSMSDAISSTASGVTVNVERDARVTTSSGMSNPIALSGANGTVNVSGRVQSSAGNADAILVSGTNGNVTIRDGGFVTAQSSGSNAINVTGTNGTVTLERGSEVVISAGNSAAVRVGDNSAVNVAGSVRASSSNSQGVSLGSNSTLEVQAGGIIRTSSSESQAVLIRQGSTGAAVVNVLRGANIDAVGAQAIVDRGNGVATSVTVNGTVFGGSSEPVIDLGDGNDTIIVNGTVRGSSANPVIDLGAGDDSATINSANTVEGPGVLVAGGGGNDTVNLNNGREFNSEQFTGTEQVNTSNGTTYNQNQMQPMQNVTAQNGGTVNLNQGSQSGNVTGQAGGTVNMNGGMAANVTTQSGSTLGTNAMMGSQTQTTMMANGNFAAGTNVVFNNSAFLTGSITGTNGITQTLGSNAFSAQAAGANRRAVAGALDAAAAQGGAGRTLADAVILTSQANVDRLFDSLSGEIYAQTGAALVQGSNAFSATLQSRAAVTAQTSAVAPGAFAPVLPAHASAADLPSIPQEPLDLAPVFAVWGGVYGSSTDIDADAIGRSADADLIGGAFGIERRFGEFALAGLSIAYDRAEADDVFGEAEVDSFRIGAYGGTALGPVNLSGSLSYAFQNVDTSRQVFLPAGLVTAEGDADGHTLAASLEARVNALGFATNQVVLAPTATLDVAHFSRDGLTETGAGAANLALDDLDATSGAVGIGVTLGATGVFGSSAITAEVQALYERGFGDERVTQTARFAGTTPAFTVASTEVSEDRLRLGAALGAAINESVSLSARYDGTFSDTTETHGGGLTLSVRF